MLHDKTSLKRLRIPCNNDGKRSYEVVAILNLYATLFLVLSVLHWHFYVMKNTNFTETGECLQCLNSTSQLNKITSIQRYTIMVSYAWFTTGMLEKAYTVAVGFQKVGGTTAVVMIRFAGIKEK